MRVLSNSKFKLLIGLCTISLITMANSCYPGKPSGTPGTTTTTKPPTTTTTKPPTSTTTSTSTSSTSTTSTTTTTTTPSGSTAFVGPQGHRVDWVTGSATHTTRDYSRGQFSPNCNLDVNDFAMRALGGVANAGNSAVGGLVIGAQAPTWDNYHNCPGVKAETDGFVYDRWNIRNVGDGFKAGINGTPGSNSSMTRSWLREVHDDCIQDDDFITGVSFTQNFCDGVWVGISTRHSSSGNANGNILTIRDNIIFVKDQSVCYKPESYGCPEHGGWLKSYKPETEGAKLVLEGNTFVSDDYPAVGSLAETASIASCKNNKLLFLSTDPAQQAKFNADVASWAEHGCTGTTVLVGTAAQTAFNAAAASWHSNFDSLLQMG